MVKKISCRKIDEYLKDEAEAVKEYHDYGFHKLEADERRHGKFFRALKKAKSCSTTYGGKRPMVSKKKSLAAKKGWRKRKAKYGKSGMKKSKRRKK